MGWIPGIPIDSGATIHGYRTSRPMVTCHRTYGYWPGDYSVIQSGGLAHLLIGPDEGQWVQFAPSEGLMYHCNGSNDGYGVEVGGTNADRMTDWQLRCLRYVVPQLAALIGVPPVYSDGSDGWVNGHTYVGWHAHNGILTDDGSAQHTNLWTIDDWHQIVAPTEAAPAVESGDLPMEMPIGQLAAPTSIVIGDAVIPVPANTPVALLVQGNAITATWAGPGAYGVPDGAGAWLNAGGRGAVKPVLVEPSIMAAVLAGHRALFATPAAPATGLDVNALAAALAPKLALTVDTHGAVTAKV